MLHRFYQPSLIPEDDILRISDPELVRQLTTVLRLQPSDQFVVFTPRTEYTVAFEAAEKNTVIARLVQAATPDRTPRRRLILYQALLKKDNFELVLQKGTELGVHGFVPIVTERTIVRSISDHKRARYHKILTEATEQCGGTHTPKLSDTSALGQLTHDMRKLPGTWFVADETDARKPLAAAIADCAEPIRVIIGPEGGFAPGEIDMLHRAGVRSVTLGNRILRAETAALAAASIVLLSQ